MPVIEEYNFIALRDYFVKCFIVKVKPVGKLMLNIDVEENNEELRKLLEESRQKRIDVTLKKINPD